MRRVFLVLLLLFSGIQWMEARSLPAEPQLDGVNPRGVQRGTETTIELVGRRLEGPLELVIYDPGITVLELESQGAAKVLARIRINKDARLGEYRVRLRTKWGWTALRTLFVGALPCVEEKENNSLFEQPQEVSFGVTVHGRVTLEDVDYFVVEAKKGQRITAEVEGIRLGISLFDPHVSILDERRFELASADDTALLRQDPFASAIAPEDGRYVVAVREAAYGGSPRCRYRLHIGPLPRPTAVYPAGGKPGAEVEVTWIGDAGGVFKEKVKLPATGGTHGLYLERDGAIAPSPNKVRVANLSSVMEHEPNDERGQATPVKASPPCAFDGIIGADGDRDWFSFEAKKGREFNVWVYARTLGSPLDPSLRVVDPDGKNALINDDGMGLDSRGSFRASKDGTYRLCVRDHLEQGASDKVYRVEVRPVTAGLSIVRPPVKRNDSQNRQWVAVPRGNRVCLPLRIGRRGFSGAVNLECAQLPAGVTMHAPRVAGNTNAVPVIFEAEEDAPLEGRLCILRGVHTKNEKIRGRFQQRVDLVLGNPNNSLYYWTTVRSLPVCVIEKAPFRVSIAQPKVPLVRDGSMELKVTVHRDEGFTGGVRLTMPFTPPGINTRRVVDVAKGKTEARYLVNANNSAAAGKWRLTVQASAEVKGGGTVYVAAPHIDLEVSTHLLTGTIPLTVTTRGEATEVVCKLEQVTAFDEEAEIRLNGLPSGATTTPQKITKDTKEVVFPVATTDKSPSGQHKSLFCSLSVVRNGELIRQSFAGGGVLRIDKPRPAPKVAKPVVAKKAEPVPAKPKDKPKKRLTRLEQLRQEAAERAGRQVGGGGGL